MKNPPERILLQSIDIPRALDPVFAANLRTFIQREMQKVEVEPMETATVSGHHITVGGTAQPAVPSLPAAARPGTRVKRWDRRTRMLAAAIFLCIAVGGAGTIARLTGNDQPEPEIIPAAVQVQASPTGPAAGDPTGGITASSAVVRNLLTASIGPELDASTQMEWRNIYSTVFVLEPGESYSTENSDVTASNGVMAYSVVSGELTLNSPGPVLFLPAGSSEGELQNTGSQVELAVSSGESFAANMNTVIELSNDGSDPVTYIGEFLFNLPGEIMGNNLPQEYFDAVEHYVIGKLSAPLPEGPVTWIFDAVSIDAGGSISFAPLSGGMSVALITEGTLRFGRAGSDGTPVAGVPDTTLVAPRGTELFVGSDQVVVLANESEEAAQLYLFRIGPASAN